MILTRLVNSIRRRDWFTVFTEFVIVVFGIFFGLQANQWAQERQDRKAEFAALERLFMESKNAYGLLENRVQGTLRLNQTRRNAVQFADSETPVPKNDLPLKIGVNTLAQFPPLVPVSVVYDELKSSGQMQLIRSAALRDQVAEFHTNVLRYNQLQINFGDGRDRFAVAYQRNVTWAYNPEATTSDILLSSYDWTSLRSDEAFIFEIIGLLRNQLVAEEGLLTLRDQAKSLCETLGARVARPCELPATGS